MFKTILKTILPVLVATLFVVGAINAVTVIMVPQGGTGAATFTQDELIVGNTTGALTSTSTIQNNLLIKGNATSSKFHALEIGLAGDYITTWPVDTDTDTHRATTSLDYWFDNTAGITGNSNIVTVGTIGTGAWQADVIATAYLHADVILSSEIDTYAELNAVMADQTITHNALIDTYAELNAIVADQTLTHNALIDTSAELSAILGDETGTGVAVFATSPTFTTGIDTNGYASSTELHVNEFDVNSSGNVTSTRMTITDGVNGVHIIPGPTTTLEFF